MCIVGGRWGGGDLSGWDFFQWGAAMTTHADHKAAWVTNYRLFLSRL